MEKFSDAIFDLITGIVGSATQEPNGYPVILLSMLKRRFGRILGFFSDLLG